MEPSRQFQFCPRCGRAQKERPPDKCFRCDACEFQYYFNPAIAVAAFIVDADGLVLFIRRAKDPGKGKLAVPGGFVDAGETAEGALRREILEEVNLELTSLEFLASFPNQYHYKGVTYPVVDLFFVGRTDSTHSTAALDGVASCAWLDPAPIDLDEIAFPSMRAALPEFRRWAMSK